MRIAVIGDVHGHEARLDVVLGALERRGPELALLSGDVALDPPWLMPMRRRDRGVYDDSMRRILGTVSERLGVPVLFVPGNHDLPDPAADVAATNADGLVVEAAGLRIAGFGGAGPARFGFPYEWGEEEASRRLDRLLEGAGEIDVFLCHTPPLECRLDRTAHDQAVGSQAVREALGRARPRLFVCGHIHEAFGVERVEGVTCLNAGSLGEPFGREIAWTVDWDGGPVAIESLRFGRDGTEQVDRRPVR